MTAQGLAISILSMLSSAKEKKTPPDNAARKSQDRQKREKTFADIINACQFVTVNTLVSVLQHVMYAS